MTYRFSGHSPSDASSYRSQEEIKDWQEHDAIKEYEAYLINNKLADSTEIEGWRRQIEGKLTAVARLATDLEVSPREDGRFIEGVMFSNQRVEKFDERESEMLQSLAENSRVQAIAKKERWGLDAEGKPISKNKAFQYRDALFEAVAHRAAIDPTLAMWGEDIRDWGGAYAVYRGLTELLPYKRLFNSPISEGAIVGAGVGYALSGGRALVELMYCDFMGRAGDEIFNQMSKWQSMSAGILKMPLVCRVHVGHGYGAQHSQDWTGMCSSIPGLKVYFPATPNDAKGMLNLALRGTDPVIFFESELIYDKGEEFERVPEGYYETPEGEPIVRKPGKDLTIATLGATLYKALEAAKTLEERHGLSTEVIDLRCINPLNYDVLVDRVK
jgi:2-oxoisovalerate dehydrogenase E1 component